LNRVIDNEKNLLHFQRLYNEECSHWGISISDINHTVDIKTSLANRAHNIDEYYNEVCKYILC
jgi:hypothetical protein